MAEAVWTIGMDHRHGNLNQLRIVIVEDDALIGMLLEDLLEGLGHIVVDIAMTEPQAVCSAARFSPDVMIVDVNLAHGDGISAMRSILATRAMPHVFMTGAAAQGIPSGSVTLSKPFQQRHLVSALERALVRKSTQHASLFGTAA